MPETTIFDAQWLWSNDPKYFHPSSGQRTRSPITFYGWKIRAADVIDAHEHHQHQLPKPQWNSFHPTDTVYRTHSNDNDDHHGNSEWIKITWEHLHSNQTTVSFHNLDWILHSRYDHSYLQWKRQHTKVTPLQAINRHTALKTIDYKDFHNADTRDDARFLLLDQIVNHGAVLIQNAPHDQLDGIDTVGFIAQELVQGKLSHSSLYGDIFHVQSAPDAHNIAYTNVPLPPHQDLAYYVSKPGLQYLHCVNNRGVKGGESVLVDAIAAADALQSLAPHLFQILVDTEATFIKQRQGADMVYQRKHIETASDGEIVSVHWSPPFEGPLRIEPEKVNDYYVARAAFEILLDNTLEVDTAAFPLDRLLVADLKDYANEYTWEKALRMGEVMIFNNQRMLHGRRGFVIDPSSKENGRHLIGCYTDIDDTLSSYRQLRRQRPHDVEPFVRNFGNGSKGEK